MSLGFLTMFLASLELLAVESSSPNIEAESNLALKFSNTHEYSPALKFPLQGLSYEEDEKKRSIVLGCFFKVLYDHVYLHKNNIDVKKITDMSCNYNGTNKLLSMFIINALELYKGTRSIPPGDSDGLFLLFNTRLGRVLGWKNPNQIIPSNPF